MVRWRHGGGEGVSVGRGRAGGESVGLRLFGGKEAL
jgi:hypothetical protein